MQNDIQNDMQNDSAATVDVPETPPIAMPLAAPMAPTVPEARIEALDVVRGFALLGIFLMNIEFFNRSMHGIGEGMPLGLTGADWWASWFISYFVQGKFWTIFSLLFGMGFAVMLTRAERAQRAFLTPYVRRILALAVYGAAHFIFLWAGDILFSYAVGALALLILLYGRWKAIAIGLVVLVAIGCAPSLHRVIGIAVSLAVIALLSLYVRDEGSFTIGQRQYPRFSVVLFATGVLAAVGAALLWLLPGMPEDPRIPVTLLAVFTLLFSVLSAQYRNPVSLRSIRLGVSLYTTIALLMTVFGAVQYFTPHPAEAAHAAAAAVASEAGKPAAKAIDAQADKAAEKAAEKKAEKAQHLAENLQEARKEVNTLTHGSYLDAVLMRSDHFPEKVANDTGFALMLMAMFLMGSWFVRSGIMENTGAHLAFFRKLALIGLPLGIGLGLAGSAIAMSHIPGDEWDGFQFARGLAVIGNLPACMGYVGLVVVMLHSKSAWAGIRVLASVGRMALTNYLLQSLLCSWVFYGYGLGHWGLARSWQVVFVVTVFGVQVAASHWWLARFRFGPMEWLWRAFTYRTTPPMRLVRQGSGGAVLAH